MSQFDELPEGWEEAKIGELCTLINGKAFKPDEWTETGLKIVRIQNLNKEDALFNHFSGEVDSKFIINDGELLFAWSGTPGTSFGAHIWNRGKAVLNQHIFRVIFDESSLNKTFFRYAINQKLQELIGKAHGGVGLRHVTKGKFEQTEIFLPPLNEQRRIVEKIEALMARSRKARAALDQIPALLDQFRQSVLAAAFRGDLTADWRAQNPNVEPAEALLERIRVERRDRWEKGELEKMKVKGIVPRDAKWKEKYKEPVGLRDTSLSQIPDNWIWANVAQLSSSMLGKMLDKVKHQDGELLPYLRNVNVRWGSVNTSDVLKMYFEHDEHERYAVKKGDVLICEGGEPGRAAVWESNEVIKYQKALHRLRAFGGINPYWFVYHLWFDAITGSLEEYYTGSTIKHFTGIALAGYPIRLPSIQEQNEIVKRVSKILQLTDSFLEQYLENTEELEELDRSILAKAFRGELVPQDPTDEPAAVLLDRIRAERERLGSGKKRSKAKK